MTYTASIAVIAFGQFVYGVAKSAAMGYPSWHAVVGLLILGVITGRAAVRLAS